MSGEHHESGERDWRDDPANGSRTLDELSREEILRALTGLVLQPQMVGWAVGRSWNRNLWLRQTSPILMKLR